MSPAAIFSLIGAVVLGFGLLVAFVVKYLEDKDEAYLKDEVCRKSGICVAD